MSVQCPSLDNGHLWLCGMVIRSAQARQLIGKLSTYVRHQMEWRDLSRMKPASFYETHIEIWVHPDDYGDAAAILREALADP
jgi:hypothetical protein